MPLSTAVSCAPVDQLVESALSNSVQCGFESHPGHRTAEALALYHFVPIKLSNVEFLLY
jgi:hypothetical protein